MNQPRCVLLAALALAALLIVPATAQTIDVSLNLRYDDPNTESAGGTFTLVAMTDDADGIAALRAVLLNIDTDTGLTWTPGIGAIDPVDDGGSNQRPAVMTHTGGIIDLLYAQNLAPAVLGVGTTTTPGGLLATDPLHNSSWDNSTALISGTFGETLPAFTSIMDGIPAVEHWTDGNVNNPGGEFIAVGASAVTTTVRGDGVVTNGLIPGDANRSGTVNASDLAILSAPANWLQAGTNWDRGNFNSDGTTNASDLAILSAPSNWLQSWTPPAAGAAGSAVPEPSTAVLMIALASLAVAARLRRRV